ncbi:hypothetical protein [Streptomyces venezuelae]
MNSIMASAQLTGVVHANDQPHDPLIEEALRRAQATDRKAGTR